MQTSQQNNPAKSPTDPQKDTDNDLQKDKSKNPDLDRDANNTNPDSPKTKGDNCGC